jgi:hypothetical protein
MPGNRNRRARRGVRQLYRPGQQSPRNPRATQNQDNQVERYSPPATRSRRRRHGAGSSITLSPRGPCPQSIAGNAHKGRGIPAAFLMRMPPPLTVFPLPLVSGTCKGVRRPPKTAAGELVARARHQGTRRKNWGDGDRGGGGAGRRSRPRGPGPAPLSLRRPPDGPPAPSTRAARVPARAGERGVAAPPPAYFPLS